MFGFLQDQKRRQLFGAFLELNEISLGKLVVFIKGFGRLFFVTYLFVLIKVQ
jgi:hypothetical protein